MQAREYELNSFFGWKVVCEEGSRTLLQESDDGIEIVGVLKHDFRSYCHELDAVEVCTDVCFFHEFVDGLHRHVGYDNWRNFDLAWFGGDR